MQMFIHKLYSNGFFKNTVQCLLLTSTLVLSACSTQPNQGIEQTQSQESNKPTNKKGPYEKTVMNEPSVVSYKAPDDPLRAINEPIFTFNDYAYRYVLSPLAAGYEKIMPEPIDKGITNFFYNLREPLYAINHLFQGNFSESGDSLARVIINTTVGIAGLFDAADGLMGIEREKTTFGNTLAHYGVGHGAYLVLPLLGPSDFRDTGSLTFNYFAHPLNFINDETAAQQLLIFDGVHAQVPVLSNYPKVVDGTENKYEFVRNLYMQNLKRDGQVKREETFNAKEKE